MHALVATIHSKLRQMRALEATMHRKYRFVHAPEVACHRKLQNVRAPRANKSPLPLAEPIREPSAIDFNNNFSLENSGAPGADNQSRIKTHARSPSAHQASPRKQSKRGPAAEGEALQM